MTYVLFVPWLRIELDSEECAKVLARFGREHVSFPGHEFQDKNKSWKTTTVSPTMAWSREFHEVWYTGRISSILFSMLNGQIYIRGHGQPGRHLISSGEKGAHDKHELGAVDVADRLIASGLQTGFAGKIKCYNCHSAEQKGLSEPFAQVFADYMWKKGFKSCTYWGYVGALTSFYETRGKEPHPHKYSGYKEEFESGGALWHDVRASKARLQIFPG